MEVKHLQRGDVVMAVNHLDIRGANVRKGTLGVVFNEMGYYGDGAGPIVRWMNVGVCNVYNGDVVKVSGNRDKLDIVDRDTGEVYGKL